MSIRLHPPRGFHDNEDKELRQAKAAPPDFTTMDPWQGLLDWLAGPVLGERCIGRGDFDLLRLVDAPAEAAGIIIANSRKHGWIVEKGGEAKGPGSTPVIDNRVMLPFPLCTSKDTPRILNSPASIAIVLLVSFLAPFACFVATIRIRSDGAWETRTRWPSPGPSARPGT